MLPGGRARADQHPARQLRQPSVRGGEAKEEISSAGASRGSSALWAALPQALSPPREGALQYIKPQLSPQGLNNYWQAEDF